LLINILLLEKCVFFPLHLQAIVIGKILRRRGNFFSKRLKNIEDRKREKSDFSLTFTENKRGNWFFSFFHFSKKDYIIKKYMSSTDFYFGLHSNAGFLIFR